MYRPATKLGLYHPCCKASLSQSCLFSWPNFDMVLTGPDSLVTWPVFRKYSGWLNGALEEQVGIYIYLETWDAMCVCKRVFSLHYLSKNQKFAPPFLFYQFWLWKGPSLHRLFLLYDTIPNLAPFLSEWVTGPKLCMPAISLSRLCLHKCNHLIHTVFLFFMF